MALKAMAQLYGRHITFSGLLQNVSAYKSHIISDIFNVQQ